MTIGSGKVAGSPVGASVVLSGGGVTGVAATNGMAINGGPAGKKDDDTTAARPSSFRLSGGEGLGFLQRGPLRRALGVAGSLWFNASSPTSWRFSPQVLDDVLFDSPRPPVIRGPRLRDASSVGPGQTITAKILTQRLTPPTSVQGWISIDELVNIELCSDGTIIITAKNFKPGEKGTKSLERVLTSMLLRTPQYSLPCREFLRRGDERALSYLGALWGVHLIADAGGRLVIKGAENVDPNARGIFLPTHDSMMEFGVKFLVDLIIGCPGGFLADEKFKYGLWRLLVGNTMMESRRFSFTTRKNTDKAREQMAALAADLSDPDNVFWPNAYLQGTRAHVRVAGNGERTDGDLYAKQLGLRDGVLHTAIASGRPVVPVVFNGMGRTMPSGMHRILTHQTIECVLGEAIPSVGESVISLKTKVDDFYRAHRQAPLIDRESVVVLERMRRIRGDINTLKNPKNFSVDLRILMRVQREATTLDNIANNRSLGMFPPMGVNGQRLALNIFLDRLYEVLVLHEKGRIFERDAWLVHHNIKPAWFDAFYEWLDDGEKRAILERNAKTDVLMANLAYLLGIK